MRAGTRLFITGIPTAGKSFLAQQLAKETGGLAVCLDDLRSVLASDERYRAWVRFYADQDERAYYADHDADERWHDLVAQSEALWPAFLQAIALYRNMTVPVIFESVNLLPHLLRRDFPDDPGLALVGTTYEAVFERNCQAPRWGMTAELQALEAHEFFDDERPRYIAEAKKYGYPVFESSDAALPTARKFISG